jgi:hypothetical protein
MNFKDKQYYWSKVKNGLGMLAITFAFDTVFLSIMLMCC